MTGMLIDLGYAAYSGKGTGETAILRQLSSTLRAGDIVVADSYHCTYWFIWGSLVNLHGIRILSSSDYSKCLSLKFLPFRSIARCSIVAIPKRILRHW